MAIRQEVISGFLLALSAISSVVCIIFTAMLFRQYFNNWTQPKTQNLVMRVILLVPVWAILSTVNVALPTLHFITAIFLDLYEGFAILSFMQLIYHYLGGRDQAQNKATMKHPYRCLGCLCFLHPGERFMQILHVMIYQFVITRPLFAILNCIFYYNGMLKPGGLKSGDPLSLFLILGVLMCLFVAMWGLLQVYRTFNLILQPNNVGSKFMAIKVYILLHAVQGFIFAALASKQETPDQKLNIIRLEYAVVSVEMMIGAVLNKHLFFRYEEYIDYEKAETAERIRLEENRYNTESDSLISK